jgi:hypothetical protein
MATTGPPQEHFALTPQMPLVYSAKFVCGEFKEMEIEGPVKPGNYATNINVHNPNRRTVLILKKAILLFDSSDPDAGFPERPRPPTEEDPRKLRPDHGMEIDCRVIREQLLQGTPRAPTFIKGWVVIESVSGHPLDVVAVYTARSAGPDGTASLSIATDRALGIRVSP